MQPEFDPQFFVSQEAISGSDVRPNRQVVSPQARGGPNTTKRKKQTSVLWNFFIFLYLYSCIFFRQIVISAFDWRIAGSLGLEERECILALPGLPIAM